MPLPPPPHASPAMQVLGKELGIRVKNEMFERWQFSRKLKEGRGGDPILPAQSFFDPGLDAELQGLGVNKAQSRNLCCELGRASKSALKTLKKQVLVLCLAGCRPVCVCVSLRLCLCVCLSLRPSLSLPRSLFLYIPLSLVLSLYLSMYP